jgi:phytoene dehydrogenase-like protein
MQSNHAQYDVVVIGGGVAGLAASAFIARAGRRVLVLEQSRELGGRARTREHEGFYLNQGPHALYRAGRGIEVLGQLGIQVHGKPPAVSGAYAVKGGIKHAFPVGFVSLLSTTLFGAAAKFETARFLASLLKIDAGAVMNTSLRDWVNSKIDHQEVRDFLYTVCRIATYTNAPDLMSAGVAIDQLQKAFEKNVLYLNGGWQTIVDGLIDTAKAAGVDIETGSRVDHLDRETGGAIRGVVLDDGRQIGASTVVIASSPAVAASLVEDVGRSSLQRFADEALPVRAACLDLALSGLPKPRVTAAFGVDQPLYLSVHSAAARLAPQGSALIHLAKYLEPGVDQEPEEVEREMEALMDLVQPGWRHLVVYRRFLPEMVVINAMTTATMGGAIGRPSPAVDEAPGVYVVGDWVGPEGLLVDASLASAKLAADMVSERYSATMAMAS